VIGAGSFGIVRECFELSSGRRYAVKTIGKAPKRGLATPRYLLKLRTEVEIMQQLGYSLDAVNLKVVMVIHFVAGKNGCLNPFCKIRQPQYSLDFTLFFK
jgi:serine/threonine protein kinase